MFVGVCSFRVFLFGRLGRCWQGWVGMFVGRLRRCWKVKKAGKVCNLGFWGVWKVWKVCKVF